MRKKAFLLIVCPLLMITGLAVLDYNRLAMDFDHLSSLLKNAWLKAIHTNTKMIVKFDGHQVTVTSEETSRTITAEIPTLDRVDYDTTLGDDMIVFTGHGTNAYNKRVHGGEIMLRSVLGFRRYIHVNCTGYVREGRYPEE